MIGLFCFGFRAMWKLSYLMIVMMVYLVVLEFALMWWVIYGLVALVSWGRSTRRWKLKRCRVLGLPLYF